MHGPGSTTIDVAKEMSIINEMIGFQMSYGKSYAATIRSEIGMAADLIAEDMLSGEEPFHATVTRYKLLKGVQRRVLAEIHQRYANGNL